MKDEKVIKLETTTKFDQGKEKSDINKIVGALQYLSEESKRCGSEDIHNVIEAAFKICFSIHYAQLRGEYPTDN